ncbi:hypothetical protein PENTCL1PPCAC_4524, partial [Pristionchus entomophagus]
DLLSHENKSGKYKGEDVLHLVRAIRNKNQHPRNWLPDVQAAFGETTDSFVTYFTRKFPELLLHVYKELEWCSDESSFKPYYTEQV